MVDHAAPPARRADTADLLHGHLVADPYRWLEDPDDPETVSWSAAQDGHYASHRDGWDTREWFRDALTGLEDVGAVSPPVWRGDTAFFARRTPGSEHAAVIAAGPGGERVLLDPMLLDPSGATTIDAWQPSPDGTVLAYRYSVGGTEDSSLLLIDVATGEVVEGPIDRARWGRVAWLPSGRAYYYSRYLPPGAVPGDHALHRRVYLHQVGADPATDVLITGEGSPAGRYYNADVSDDGRWLTVAYSQGTDPRTTVLLADLDACPPHAPVFRVVQEGADAWTAAHVRAGRVYLQTDRDAPRGRVCVADPADPGYASWRELVGEDPAAVLTDYAVLDHPDLPRGLLLTVRTRHAISELTVHDLATGTPLRTVPLPGTGTVNWLYTSRADSRDAWFTYTDFATPGTVYRFDGATQEITVHAVPPGEPASIGVVTRQVVYPGLDGTPVRMFLLTGGGEPGPSPAILYGYGGFRSTLAPRYWPQMLAWVRAGGVVALAGLRGGAEEGEEWHRAGMLGCKQNTFDDFQAAARWLIAEGWTTPDRLVVKGGSNGGLLVGAAVTQFPELFAGALCSAPLLDMLRYELYGLGSTWSGEYGTVADPEQFGWLLGYSPYHRVRVREYPAVLLTVFEGDGRVDLMHARKFAAALQYATTGAAPILLRREREVGHSSRAVSRAVALGADELGFAAAVTGLRPGAAT